MYRCSEAPNCEQPLYLRTLHTPPLPDRVCHFEASPLCTVGIVQLPPLRRALLARQFVNGVVCVEARLALLA
tara:strand:- start:26 stop:241 length:216 start_codon:yes stop_codon:yes gene_type:complete